MLHNSEANLERLEEEAIASPLLQSLQFLGALDGANSKPLDVEFRAGIDLRYSAIPSEWELDIEIRLTLGQ